MDSSPTRMYGGLLNIKSNEYLANGSSQSEQIKSILLFDRYSL